MILTDLEALLGITVAEPQKRMYEARLAAAIDHVSGECGERWTNKETGEIGELPPGVQMGVALLVKAMAENPGVASQSLGDMSKSFFEGGTAKAAATYWKRYRRAKFI